MKKQMFVSFILMVFVLLMTISAAFAIESFPLRDDAGKPQPRISTAVTSQGAAVLTSDGVYWIDPANLAAPLQGVAAFEYSYIATENGINVNYLIAGEQEIFGIDQHSGHLYKLNKGAGVFESVVQLKGWEYSTIKSALIQGDNVYILFENERDVYKSVLVCWVLADGRQAFQVDTGDMQLIARYHDDALLAVERNDREIAATSALGQFSLTSKTFREMQPLQQKRVSCLAYHQEDDQIYFLGDDMLYRGTAFGAYEGFAYLSGLQYSCDNAGMVFSNRYSVIAYDSMFSTDIHAQLTDEVVLTIAGVGIEKPYVKAASRFPNIALMFEASNYSTERVLTDFLTQSNAIDLYSMDYSVFEGQIVHAILAKGYTADLTFDSEVMDFYQGLPLFVKEGITFNGQIGAIPIAIGSYRSMYTYDEALMAQTSLTPEDMPTNLIDLYQFLIDWCENPLPEYDGIYPISMSDELTKMAGIAIAYSEHVNANGDYPTYDTPLFRQLVTIQKQACLAMEQAELLNPRFEQDIQAMWIQPFLINTTASDSLTLRDYWSKETSFGFAIAPGESPVYPVYLDLLIVNRLSNHVAETTALVGAFIGDQTPANKMSLNPATLQPLLSEEYQGDQARALEQKARLQQAQKDASEDQVREYMDEINEIDLWLQSTGERAYAISEVDIANYQKRLETAYLPTFYVQNLDGFAELCAQYDAGNISLDAFIQRLDQRIQMVKLENQ